MASSTSAPPAMPDLDGILERAFRANRKKVLDTMIAMGMRSKYLEDRAFAEQVMIWRSMEGDERTVDLVLMQDQVARLIHTL